MNVIVLFSRLTAVAKADVGRLAIKEANGAGLQRKAVTAPGRNVQLGPIVGPMKMRLAVVACVGKNADAAVNT